MEYHYDVLHAGYEKLLNNCVENYEMKNNLIFKHQHQTPEELIRCFHLLPASNFTDPLEKDLLLHAAGGLVNHNIFFSILKGGQLQKNNFPVGQLANMISEQFGGWENLKKKLINASKTLYLSGWV
jgi:superoxide dismutase